MCLAVISRIGRALCVRIAVWIWSLRTRVTWSWRSSVADRWWVIHEDEILKALVRAGAGDHPELVMVELLAGCEVEVVPPSE